MIRWAILSLLWFFMLPAAAAGRALEIFPRTIALEVGMQNGGLASGIALQMGKVATIGLAPAVFGPMMNITGSSLATWWRRSEEAKETEAASPDMVSPPVESKKLKGKR